MKIEARSKAMNLEKRIEKLEKRSIARKELFFIVIEGTKEGKRTDAHISTLDPKVYDITTLLISRPS